nr:TIGR04282 family arsenosugar biosynthesis glycosyltransferase [Algoriphagus locisalis]
MKDGLIIFQKNAELGKVKTRLAATIGDQAAFEAYQSLVKYTHKVTSQSVADKVLFFTNSLEEDLSTYPRDYRFELQSGEGLGDKMKNAFDQLFEEKYDRLVIIGTDCAEITPELISEAFEKLRNHEVVIGPAQDGGYYLLGMRSLFSGIFEGIPWSTDQVTALTVSFLERESITYDLLPVLSDVDTKEDWDRFKDKL